MHAAIYRPILHRVHLHGEGYVAAAVCSASASNFIGIFVTPLLVSAFVLQGAAGGRSTIEAVGAIVVQLLLPFIAGQLLRGRIGAWVDRHKPVLKLVDQGAILLVVYGAFSAAVTEGIWRRLGLASLAALCLLCCALLAIVLGLAA